MYNKHPMTTFPALLSWTKLKLIQHLERYTKYTNNICHCQSIHSNVYVHSCTLLVLQSDGAIQGL